MPSSVSDTKPKSNWNNSNQSNGGFTTGFKLGAEMIRPLNRIDEEDQEQNSQRNNNNSNRGVGKKERFMNRFNNMEKTQDDEEFENILKKAADL